MLLRLFAMLAAILAATPAWAQSAARDSVGFVSATIDGKGPYWFLVDSGANRSALDDDVAKSLGLMAEGKSMVEGTAGTVEVAEARIGRLVAGLLDVRDLRPTVYDLSGSLAPEGQTLAGILGFDALRESAVLFDPRNGRIAFAAWPEELASLGGATMVPFELDNDIPRVDVLIEGVPTQLRIDTGAAIGDGPATFVNITEPFYRKLLERDPSLTPYTHFTASGVGGETRIAVVKGKSLSIGGAIVAGPRFIVQPPIGYFERADAVGFLGSYAFKAWPAFILDYPRKRLILLDAK